jgi:hypothetical protein
MPKRIVKQPITLHRDGKVVKPRLDEVFEFTDAELKSIMGANPKAVEHIVTGPTESAASAKPAN